MNVSAPPGIDMRANPDYYRGKPTIDRIEVTNYPNVRAAWADMLRNKVDMLFEVAPDALDSLESASTVSVFKFTRRYQYVMLLNPKTPGLRSPLIRRALNLAIDRAALVREGMNGSGVPSYGPVWPQNWAFDASLPNLSQNLQEADAIFRRQAEKAGHLTLRCVVPADSVYERISLEVKRQLEAMNVDLVLDEAPPEQISARFQKGDFDMLLMDILAGPTMFRVYQWWHTDGFFNLMHYSSPAVDAALDTVRHAANDDDYRRGVAAFEQSIVANPPAIFLAWGERARAVSNRFVVPTEPGRDILPTMYTWRPRTDKQMASRN